MNSRETLLPTTLSISTTSLIYQGNCFPLTYVHAGTTITSMNPGAPLIVYYRFFTEHFYCLRLTCTGALSTSRAQFPLDYGNCHVHMLDTLKYLVHLLKIEEGRADLVP